MRVALGLKARAGRAVHTALGGDVLEPQLIERSQMQLLPDGARAPYHPAEGLEPAAARMSVRKSIAAANRLATSGLREAARRLFEAGHELRHCAVLIGPGVPNSSTDEILAVHVRMHEAEGELFRDRLVAGVRACDLELTTLANKSALEDAARMLGRPARGWTPVSPRGEGRPSRPGARTRRRPQPLRWSRSSTSAAAIARPLEP